jgi:Glycosyl transferase family 2
VCETACAASRPAWLSGTGHPSVAIVSAAVGLPTWARRLITSSVGLWPALEIRNRIFGASAILRNRRFQADEVRRLRQTFSGHQFRARVLVVIPTYKRAEALVRAVESALSQTYRDLVVVVVDDGAGLPDLDPDPRLRAVSLSRNSGSAGLVRNVGIALADSEFIAFLDDDNIWTRDHVATAVAALQENPTLSGVYTSVRRLWPDGSEFDVLGQPFDRGKLKEESYVDTNSIVVRRSFQPGFSVLPRNKRIRPSEDWEYVWRMSRRARLTHVDRVTVLYLVNPDSYHTTWGEQAWFESHGN